MSRDVDRGAVGVVIRFPSVVPVEMIGFDGRRSGELPTHQQLTEPDEHISDTRFREDVTELQFGFDLLDAHFPVGRLQVLAKPVHAHVVKLRACSVLSGIKLGKRERSDVVFPDGGLEQGFDVIADPESGSDGLDNFDKR